MTYGLAGYHIVTPITSQRDKADAHRELLDRQTSRASIARAALRLVRTAESIEAVIAAITVEHAAAPRWWSRPRPARSRFRPPRRRTPSELLAEATLDPAPAADSARHRLGPGRRA